MSELPYMPVVVNDEIAETADLTNEELGALTRIKWALWKAGGFLADDGRQLARIARAGSRWGKIAPAILRLLTVEGGRVSSPSVIHTLLITRGRRAKSAKAVAVRFAKPEGPLTSSKSLIGHESGVSRASSEHMQSKSKSKSKNIDSSLLPGAAAAAGAAGHASKGAETAGSVEALNEAEALNETLYVHGTELLVERVGLERLPARAQVSRWLCDVEAECLARLLADAERENLRGARFVKVVDERVAALARERVFGAALPFPPTLAVKRGGAA